MNDISRRSALKSVAWAAPVIAVAVAAPLASASMNPCPSQTYIYDPLSPENASDPNRSTQNNAATIRVITGSAVVVIFVRDTNGGGAINIDGKLYYKRDGIFKAGESFSIPLDECVDPKFIQVDNNNVHYYGGGVFR